MFDRARPNGTRWTAEKNGTGFRRQQRRSRSPIGRRVAIDTSRRGHTSQFSTFSRNASRRDSTQFRTEHARRPRTVEPKIRSQPDAHIYSQMRSTYRAPIIERSYATSLPLGRRRSRSPPRPVRRNDRVGGIPAADTRSGRFSSERFTKIQNILPPGDPRNRMDNRYVKANGDRFPRPREYHQDRTNRAPVSRSFPSSSSKAAHRGTGRSSFRDSVTGHWK
ncbi:uncharacterized protein DEA37_0004397 [Paragonimus westermani]|uniref:Uncharacterized protein n=1 Tax=Paragonimus westermani TaxID=34504 RepID=A0A5J4NXY4_9TREM|nr:uncharacterized protein DEA37_0004397 [Paragonimus westermani]